MHNTHPLDKVLGNITDQDLIVSGNVINFGVAAGELHREESATFDPMAAFAQNNLG